MPQYLAYSKRNCSLLISTIIVHWNTPDLLAECLASVRAQNSAHVAETIVVDSSSSIGAVQSLVESFDGVRLIQLSENRGYAAGCNAGFEVAKSEIALFLNADIELAPDATEAIAGCFGLNPRVGLVAPLLFNADGTLQSSGYSFPGLANVASDLLPVPDRLRGSRLNGRRPPGNYFHPYEVDYALGAAVAVRSEALSDIGGWDESFGMYSEEVDLCQRLRVRDWSCLVEPRARAIHYGGASTAQRPAEMVTALWHSRGIYHSRWTNWPRRLLMRWLVNAATRLGSDQDQGATVRSAFYAGLGQ